MDRAWNDPSIYGAKSNPDISIWVLDSGSDPRHPDLVDKYRRDSAGSSTGFAIPGFPDFSDVGGHGTLVSGVAAASVDDRATYTLPLVQVCDAVGGSGVGKDVMPTSRRELAGGMVGSVVYAIGGRSSATILHGQVEGFDVETSTWTTFYATMPTARCQHAVAELGGLLFAIGGTTDFSDPIGLVEIYDPGGDFWSTASSSMPTPRSALAAVSLGGTVYAIGGSAGTGATTLVEAYDPATDSWTTAPPLNGPRDALGAVALNGLIYAVGGDAGAGPVVTVETWDGSATYWTVSASSLPTARSWLAVTTDGSSIFAVGGENAGSLPVGVDERFDPASATWTTRTLADPASRGLGAGWRDGDGVGHWALIGGKGGGGMAGMAWKASLVPVRMFDGEKFAGFNGDYALDLARAGAGGEKANRLGRPSHRIINLSWGSWPPDMSSLDQTPGLVSAIDRQGNVVVAAVGNHCKPPDPACSTLYCSDPQNVYAACHSVWEPAMLPRVIGVGQSNGDCQWEGMAGPEVALVAPSAGALTTVPFPDGGRPPVAGLYGNPTGTSIASPMVAGTAACLVDQNPDWYGETVRRRLTQTAFRTVCAAQRTCGQCTYEQENGAGRLDAYAALGGPPGGPGCDWLYLSDSRSVLDATALPDFRGTGPGEDRGIPPRWLRTRAHGRGCRGQRGAGVTDPGHPAEARAARDRSAPSGRGSVRGGWKPARCFETGESGGAGLIE
jgi:hypothetical protein